MLGAVLVFLAALLTSACGGGSSPGTPARGGRGGGTAPVVKAAVRQKDVPVLVEAIGNVEAYTTVSIKAQVGGQLAKVHFNEGDTVHVGQLLFTIDPASYQAALDSAKATLVRDEALLRQAQATLERDRAQADYTRAEIERYGNLLGRGLVAKEQADQAKSSAEGAAAGVRADQAAVASAEAQIVGGKAAVETAALQLSYTTIRSPIDGRTGNVSVKAGNIVTANVTELTTIAQVEPTYVTFSVPAVNLPDIKKYMTAGPVAVFASSQDQPSPTGEMNAMATGKLTFIDNAVDAATDTIKLKATFENKEHRLWPGQFARVTLRLTTMPNAVVVPSEAVQTGQDGQFVFVVKQDSTVEMRVVVAGARAGQDTVIASGLKPGEIVVTEGQVRLEQGTRVTDAPQVPGGGGRGTGRGGRGGGRRGQQGGQGSQQP